MNNERPFYLLYVLVFLLVVLFLVVSGAEAQTLSVQLHCTDAGDKYAHIEASAAYDYLLVWTAPASNLYWSVSENGLTGNVPVSDFLQISAHLRDGEELIRYYDTDVNCDEATEVPAGRECLGIDWDGAGIFTVDGLEYPYDNHLSFVVPFDAIWRWELFIDGQKILVFEQTAPGNCRIVEDYRP